MEQIGDTDTHTMDRATRCREEIRSMTCILQSMLQTDFENTSNENLIDLIELDEMCLHIFCVLLGNLLSPFQTGLVDILLISFNSCYCCRLQV